MLLIGILQLALLAPCPADAIAIAGPRADALSVPKVLTKRADPTAVVCGTSEYRPTYERITDFVLMNVPRSK